VRAGFIDKTDDGRIVIHNWSERTGGDINKMEDRAERVRERRAHTQGKCLPSCSLCAEHVPGSDPPLSQAQINQDQARPGQARPDLKREETAPLPLDPPAEGEVWSAGWWFVKFKTAWQDKNIAGATAFYGQTGDSKAKQTLSQELARLPDPVKLEAQRNSAAMFTAFLSGGNDETRKRLWPFSFFVQAFGELRMKAAKARSGPPPTRPPDSGPAIPAAMRLVATKTEAAHGDT
jgi:hypothetical protein